MSTTATAPTTVPVASPPDAPYHIRAEQFHRMIVAEVFPPESRVYLWDGRIYEAVAKSLAHAVTFAKIVGYLVPRLPQGWFAWPENPITIADDRVPLPDVVIVRGAPDDYASRNRHPGPGDVGLVIEIARTSVRVDTTTRLEAYARSAVPIYWVADLPARRIMVGAEPRVEGGIGVYGSIQTYGPEDMLPLVLDGREVLRVSVSELLSAESAR